MQKPLELTFRDIEKSDAIESLVLERVERLEQFCDNITSCHVVIEQPQEHQSTGNPYKVMIEVRIPPNKNLVVRRDPGEGEMHDPLDVVVRDAFTAMERQVKKTMDLQRDDVKTPADAQVVAIVKEVVTDEDYGFLQTLDGRDIYFHKNAVIHGDWDRLEVGTGVRYVEREGEDGPQASTVQIVDKPGVRGPLVKDE